jgi:hypothetical protein
MKLHAHKASGGTEWGLAHNAAEDSSKSFQARGAGAAHVPRLNSKVASKCPVRARACRGRTRPKRAAALRPLVTGRRLTSFIIITNSSPLAPRIGPCIARAPLSSAVFCFPQGVHQCLDQSGGWGVHVVLGGSDETYVDQLDRLRSVSIMQEARVRQSSNVLSVRSRKGNTAPDCSNLFVQ